MKTIKGCPFFERLGDYWGTTNLVLWIGSFILGGAILFCGVSYYLYRQELWSLITMFRPRPEPIFWDAVILPSLGAGLVLLGLAGIAWVTTGLIGKRQRQTA